MTGCQSQVVLGFVDFFNHNFGKIALHCQSGLTLTSGAYEVNLGLCCTEVNLDLWKKC